MTWVCARVRWLNGGSEEPFGRVRALLCAACFSTCCLAMCTRHWLAVWGLSPCKGSLASSASLCSAPNQGGRARLDRGFGRGPLKQGPYLFPECASTEQIHKVGESTGANTSQEAKDLIKRSFFLFQSYVVTTLVNHFLDAKSLLS